jgi:uncharacterized protein
MAEPQVPPLELLQSVHTFPGTYQIRAIGSVENDFIGRVVALVQGELAGPSEVDYAERFTPDGRHVSVTLDITVQSAEQVLLIYQQLQGVEGLRFLL